MARDQIVDEGIGDMRRNQRQELGGTGRGQLRIHMPSGYPKEPAASTVFDTPSFFNHKELIRSQLCRIP
jgi:hypothetical protein